MKKILSILFILIAASALSQAPKVVTNPMTGHYYKFYSFAEVDSAAIFGKRDTLWKPAQTGTLCLDSNTLQLAYWNGTIWSELGAQTNPTIKTVLDAGYNAGGDSIINLVFSGSRNTIVNISNSALTNPYISVASTPYLSASGSGTWVLGGSYSYALDTSHIHSVGYYDVRYTGTDSTVIAGYGLLQFLSGKKKTFIVDTSVIASALSVLNKFNKAGDSASFVWLPSQATGVMSAPSTGGYEYFTGNKFTYTNSLGKTIQFSTSYLANNITIVDSFSVAMRFIGRYEADTVHNKTFSGLDNVFTSIANSSLVNSTISGISLGSNLAALTNGYGILSLSYTGSTTLAVTVDTSKIATLNYVLTHAGVAAANTAGYYLNGYNVFSRLNSDSILEGSTNLFFTINRVRADTASILETQYKASQLTISGVKVGNTLNTLIAGRGLIGGNYTGATVQTWILDSALIPTFANGWGLTGNGGTVSTNFIGTTDAHSFRIKANNVLSMYIDSTTRYVGINTAVPVSNLTISTPGIGVVPNNANGITLSNTTAATSTLAQCSPGITFYSSNWDPSAVASVPHTWTIRDSSTKNNGATSYLSIYNDGALQMQLRPGYVDMLGSFLVVNTIQSSSTLITVNAPLYGPTNSWAVSNGIVVGGGTTLNSSAIFECLSTTKGFLPPRMTSAQWNAIASPATALMGYNTGLNALAYYNGTTTKYLAQTDTLTKVNGMGLFWNATNNAFTPALLVAGVGIGINNNAGSVTISSISDPTLFTQTTSGSVSATTSETVAYGTGIGSDSIAANYLIAGKVLMYYMAGVESMPAITAGTITIKVYYGSTVIATGTTSATGLAGLTNASYTSSLRFTCQTGGASGTATVDGSFNYSTGNNLAKNSLDLNNGGSVITGVDFTSKKRFYVTLTLSTATGESVKTNTYYLQALN